MEPRDIILRPVVTEKSTGLMGENKYTFEVALKANKHQIRDAVEKIFNVRVESVRTMRQRGKWRRQGRTEGRRPDWKKAIVTLAEGDRIEIYEGL